MCRILAQLQAALSFFFGMEHGQQLYLYAISCPLNVLTKLEVFGHENPEQDITSTSQKRRMCLSVSLPQRLTDVSPEIGEEKGRHAEFGVMVSARIDHALNHEQAAMFGIRFL